MKGRRRRLGKEWGVIGGPLGRHKGEGGEMVCMHIFFCIVGDNEEGAAMFLGGNQLGWPVYH